VGRRKLRTDLFPGIKEDHSVVTCLAKAFGGMNPEQYEVSPDYTLTGRGASHHRTEIVLEEFLEALKTIPDPTYLVLRLHPRNRIEGKIFLAM